MPKGYVCAEFEVTDPTEWAKYVPLAQASLKEFDARYVVRGSTAEMLEGDLGARRISILEFESPDRAREWYNSPLYLAARMARQFAANVSVILLSGPDGS